jgi:hypothetical protein
MCSDEEVKMMVTDWVSGLAAHFCALITQYNMCPTLHGDYVEQLFLRSVVMM